MGGATFVGSFFPNFTSGGGGGGGGGWGGAFFLIPF